MTRYFYEDHIDDVFKYFLRQHHEISFIMSFVVQQTLGFIAEPTTTATLYKGESFAQIGSEIEDAIERIGQFFPEAERSAANAGHLLTSRNKDEGVSFIGGWTVSDDEIKISARGFLELLSSKITQERFFKLHSWQPMANPFSSQISQGRLIFTVSKSSLCESEARASNRCAPTKIEVEKGEDEKDDDRLTIRFGKPDPAVSPFRMPC